MVLVEQFDNVSVESDRRALRQRSCNDRPLRKIASASIFARKAAQSCGVTE